MQRKVKKKCDRCDLMKLFSPDVLFYLNIGTAGQKKPSVAELQTDGSRVVLYLELIVEAQSEYLVGAAVYIRSRHSCTVIAV